MLPRYWIITLFFYGFFQCAQPAQLRCYKDSFDDFTTIDLENPKKLFNCSCFNNELPSMFYAFGYNGKRHGPATTALLTAFLNTKKRNVLLIDWQEEASSGYYGIKLGYVLKAVHNAKSIGEQFGRAIVTLAEAGLNMADVHLIGLSLGAHLMAHAGRLSRENGYTVARITGLDPARILFEGFPTIQKGLDRTCANFVDIIHSNPGNYGTENSHGTVDFWPNYAGKGLQPGCPPGKFEMLSEEDLCSHNRGWMYYMESLRFATAFPAAGAASYDEYVQYDGRTNVTSYMGELANTRATGNFYLTTNDHTPFGMGAEGLQPSNHARRARNTFSIPMIANLKRFLG